MRQKVSVKNKSKDESVHINARGQIEVGIRMYVEKSTKINDLLAFLKQCGDELEWDEPEFQHQENQILRVFFPVRFQNEDLERASNESVSEYLDRVSRIDTTKLEKQLRQTAKRLMAKEKADVGLITDVFTLHSSLPNN